VKRIITLQRACHYCGGTSGELLPGKGPHAAGVACLGCHRHIGWLSRAYLRELEEAERQAEHDRST